LYASLERYYASLDTWERLLFTFEGLEGVEEPYKTILFVVGGSFSRMDPCLIDKQCYAVEKGIDFYTSMDTSNLVST